MGSRGLGFGVLGVSGLGFRFRGLGFMFWGMGSRV